MEIRNLNTFLQVASLQNFTQASRELGYSQSNVSAQIKQLEEELGAPLFNRIGKSISLTSYGEELLPYARQIVSTATKVENLLRKEGDTVGTIRAGMVDSLFELLLENAFLRYHRRFPKVHLELTVDATTALKDRLRHGQLDAAFLIDDPLPPSEWYVWDSLDVPVVIVANPDNPLAKRKQVTLKDLASQEWVLMEGTAPYSLHFQNALASQELEIQPFLKLQSADTARRLAERGPFLSLLPLYTVYSALQNGTLSQLSVPEWNQTQRVQLALHRSKVMTPQIEGFLEELRDVLGGILAERLTDAPPL